MAKKMHPTVEKYTTKVDAFMGKYPTITQYEKLKEIEGSTGYPAAWFFLAAVVLVSGILTAVGGAKLLTDCVGFLYPAYMSFKSLEQALVVVDSTNSDTQWLTYWVVFSFVNICECVAGPIVRLIPFYFWLKIALIVWMWHPSTRGAQTIYEQVLRPILLPYLDMANYNSLKGKTGTESGGKKGE